MPAWYVEPDHARRLNVSLLEFWWMLEYGGFSERYHQFCAAWELEAAHAPERARAAERAAKLNRAGYEGGPTDPLDSCSFKGEAA